MVKEEASVRVPAKRADATERALEAQGRCNWLIDYSKTDRVYCGVQVVSDGLCSEHVHNMFLGG